MNIQYQMINGEVKAGEGRRGGMPRLLLFALLLGFGACSRHAEPEKANVQPSVSKPRAADALHAASGPRKVFVTGLGKYTNLVYRSWGDLGDADFYQRDIEDLARECEATPDNADVWYALGSRCYNDKSNQIACFEKAVRLAPDAIAPRLALASALASARRGSEARDALTTMYPLLASAEDVRAWSWSFQSLKYGSPQDCTAMCAFVTAQKGGSDKDRLACALVAQSMDRNDEAIGLMSNLLARTGDGNYREIIVGQLGQMMAQNSTNAALASLLEQYQTPYEKAARKLDGAANRGNCESNVAVLKETIGLATNVEMRFMLAQRLLYSDWTSSLAASNADALADMMIGDDGWQSKQLGALVQMLQRMGATNTLRRLLDKSFGASSNNPAFAIAVLSGMQNSQGYYGYGRGYDGEYPSANPDFKLIARIQKQYPSNEAVLRAMASLYAAAKCPQDAIECRTTLLALDVPPAQRVRDAAALLALLVKQGDVGAADKIAAEHMADAARNATLAVPMAAYLCAAGRTNDACDILLACLSSLKARESKSMLLQKMLDMRWPDPAQKQRVAETARACIAQWPADPQDYLANQMRGKVAKLLNDMGRAEEAFALVSMAVRAGCLIDGAQELCRTAAFRPYLAKLADEMIAGTITQANVFVAMARMCNEVDMHEQALALAMRALRCTDLPYEFTSIVGEAVRLARELNDERAVRDIIAMLDQRVRDGRCSIEMLNNASYALNEAGQAGKLDEWYTCAWRLCTNKTNQAAIQSMAQWYLQWNNTNGVREMLALMEQAGGQPTERAYMLVRLYGFVGDKAGQRRVLADIRLTFTNAQMIASYGWQYLDMLRSTATRGDAAPTNEIRMLMLEWLGNRDLPLQTRMSFCQQLYGRDDREMRVAWLEKLLPDAVQPAQQNQIRSELMNAYIESGNTAGFVRIADEMRAGQSCEPWILRNMMNQYAQLGMVAEAVVLCEQLASQREGAPAEQANLLAEAANFYLKLGNKEQALQSMEDALTACADDGNRQYLVRRAADLYRELGQAQKGLDLLLDAFGKASSAEIACNMAQQIGSYARGAEIELDVQRLVGRLLELDKSVQSLCMAASLLGERGDTATAKSYLNQALGTAATSSEKRMIYQQLGQMAETAGDAEGKLAALEALMPLTERYNRQNIVMQLSAALNEGGQYQAAADKIAAFLAASGAGQLRDYDVDSLRCAMAQSLFKADNKDAAWTAAQEVKDVRRFAEIARVLGRSADAVPRLEEALASDNADSRMAAADMLLSIHRQANDTKAIEHVADVLVSAAADAQPGEAMQIARMLGSVGRRDDAVAILKKASDGADSSVQGQIDEQIVSMLQQDGKLDAAADWLDGRPRTCVTLALKARLSAAQGKTEDAAQLYFDAMAIVDNDSQWRKSNYQYELMNLVANAKDTDWRDKTVARLFDGAGAKDAGLRQSVASMYMQAKEYDKALDEYQVALGLAKDDWQKRNCLQQYASCCVSAGKPEKAIDTYATMLKDDTLTWQGRDSLRSSLGTVYEQSGRQSQAFDVYRESIKDCEQYIAKTGTTADAVNAQFRLATLYSKVNDENEAIRVLKKIADDRPGTKDADRAKTELKRLGK